MNAEGLHVNTLPSSKDNFKFGHQKQTGLLKYFIKEQDCVLFPKATLLRHDEIVPQHLKF